MTERARIAQDFRNFIEEHTYIIEDSYGREFEVVAYKLLDKYVHDLESYDYPEPTD